jgi:hypothetical protein
MGTFKLVIANMIRKTPPKFIIGFNFLLLFVLIIPKIKKIKGSYKNYVYKEVENRRGLILEQILSHTKK